MKKGVFAVVAVALLAVLGFWWFRGRDPAGGSTGTSPNAAGSSPTAARGEEQPSGPRALPDPRRKPRGTISGTVRVKDGGPLAGADVCTSWSAQGATADDMREPICTKTDGGGAYQLVELVPGAHRITAFANGHVPAAWRDAERRRDWLDLEAGERRSGVDFTLAPGGVELSGVVEDVSGGPIGGALVTVRYRGSGWWSSRGGRVVTRSDAQGRFRVWTRAGAVSIDAQAEGYALGRAESVAPSASAEVLLTPESVLAGVVVEHDSKTPVEGAIVSVGRWSGGEETGGASARTDAQGAFRLTRLAPGRYKPTASAQGRYGEPAESVLLGLGQSVEDLVVELHPVAAVRGTILVDEGGGKTRPCPGGWLNLQDERAGRWEGDDADAQGAVEVNAVLPGKYQVEVWCEGFLPRDKYEPLTVGSADVGGQVWTVGTGGTIRGVVKTAKGEFVAGVDIVAQTTGGAARGQRSWGRDRTVDDGTFVLTGLVGGDYTLRVMAEGYLPPDEPPKASVPTGGETRAEILLAEGGKIAGAVVDTRGQPVRGARARVANAGWSWGGGGEGRTGDDGRFTIEAVRPGERRVVATRGWVDEMRRPGSTDDDVQGERVVVVAGETAQVRLVVEERTGVISGAVTDERGEAVVDAWVLASRESEAAGGRADSAARQTRWSWGRDDRPVVTGTDGKFTIGDLAPGSYAVRAYRRGGGEAIAEHVKLGASIALVIRSTGTIAGTVKGASGAPLPDEIHIGVVDEKSGFSRREKFFRTAGAFRMRDLPAGTFLVSADSSAGRVTATVTLAAGESKTDLVLGLEGKVTIKGRIVEIGTQKPVPGLSAMAQPVKGGADMMMTGGGDKQNISGDDGRFTIEGAPTGKIWVSAWPLDWEASPYAWSSTYVEVASTNVVDIGDIEVMRKRKKSSEPDGDLGFTTVEQPPDLDPKLAELEVAHVRPGGPAARAGLVAGDLVTTIDGLDVKGVHLRRAWVLMDVKEGASVTFGLARGASVKITAGPPL